MNDEHEEPWHFSLKEYQKINKFWSSKRQSLLSSPLTCVAHLRVRPALVDRTKKEELWLCQFVCSTFKTLIRQCKTKLRLIQSYLTLSYPEQLNFGKHFLTIPWNSPVLALRFDMKGPFNYEVRIHEPFDNRHFLSLMLLWASKNCLKHNFMMHSFFFTESIYTSEMWTQITLI